jgi:hypothetical protein
MSEKYKKFLKNRPDASMPPKSSTEQRHRLFRCSPLPEHEPSSFYPASANHGRHEVIDPPETDQSFPRISRIFYALTVTAEP